MAKRKFEDRLVDDSDKKTITISRLSITVQLFKFIRPYRGYFIAGLLFLMFSSTTMMGFPYLAGKLIDVATGKTDAYFSSIEVISIMLIGVLLLQAFFSFFRVYTFANVSERAMSDVRHELYSRLIVLPMPFFESRRVGELNSRINADISQLSDVLSFTLAEFFRQVSVLFIGIIILLFTSTKLTVFMLATFPVLVVAAILFGRLIRKQSKKSQDELANSNTIVEETLQNIQAVKIFTNEFFEANRYRLSLELVRANGIKTALNRGLFISFLIFGLFGGIVLVLWYGSNLVASGQLTIGGLTAFIIYTSFIGASVGGLGDMYGQLQKTIGATERVFELLHETPENALATNISQTRLEGGIHFENVSFAYPSRPELEVLQNINFQIPPGSKVAIVGQSGSGKSTIMQLLLRFHKINKGNIKVDGTNIYSYSLPDLRNNIGVVPQEIMLFGGTIKDNIAYGNIHATDAQIQSAAMQANAMEFISRFPDGLQTIVGERGMKLSGGQRQRIAIARAILKNPPILILDEATSALDTASEQLVQEALTTLMEHRTTLIIAHRLSTVRNADLILVLNNGVLVEQGSYESLSSNPDSTFSKMLRIQLGIELEST